MGKILFKKQRLVEVDGKSRMISRFEKHYAETGKDYHSKHGTITKKDLSKPAGTEIKLDHADFVMINPDFIDEYKRIKRGVQIITLKDIGSIIVNTGITKDSKVLDAGSGSGAAACFIAKIAKKVVSYEINDDNLEVVRQNIKHLGISNLIAKKGDIYNPKTVSEKGFDVFLLDVPEPWRAIDTAKKALKIGGFLAGYIPNISQVQEFVNALPEQFLIERIIEVIERDWAVDKNRTRPKTKDHGHTAFLVFVRKIK